jgi:hypothetical protein
MGLAHVLAFITTPVILAILFFLIVSPLGFIRRLGGADPLNRRSASEGSYWRPYRTRQSDPRHFEKMY